MAVSVYEDAGRLLKRLADRSGEILGENLVGVYLHGSYAMGCYNPAKSDLDVIVVAERPLADACKRRSMDMITALDPSLPARSGAPAPHGGLEMSVVLRRVCDPFAYPTPFELHFSRSHLEWYRKDPDSYIRKMKGTDRDLAAHFAVIGRRGLCLRGAPVSEVFGEVPRADYLDSILYDVEGAREQIADNTMYLTLNLARGLAYQAEGLILSKKEGGEWGLRNLPEAYRPLIRAALDDYGSDADAAYDRALAGEYAAYMLGRMIPA